MWEKEWKDVGEKDFSDEKKSKLDGAHGFTYYWHDLRKKKRFFFSRHQGVGLLMVSGAFSSKERSTLGMLTGKQCSSTYAEVLQNLMLCFGDWNYASDFIFHHHNARIQTSLDTRKWLAANNGTTMKWPARSPNLNKIENI